jgi:hypothetical protein
MNALFNNAIDNAVANAPLSATAHNLTPEQAVDRLAYIKGAISALKEEEQMCKDVLITSNVRVVETDFFRCTVAEVAEGKKVNWQALAMSLNPSQQKIRAYTEATAGYFRVDVKAKKTS